MSGRRGSSATPKEEVGRRKSLERKQKTPPRSWLHRVAAKLTISRGTKGTIKSRTGDKTETTIKQSGLKRKPIPSFAPPVHDEDSQDRSDDTPSLSQSSGSHEADTHGSTHRSSTSIRTPRSIEDHSDDATKDQAWDFGEDEDNYPAQSKGESNIVSPPLRSCREYDLNSIKFN
jgi:hypothetical protein